MTLEAMYYDGSYDSAFALCRWANDDGHCIAMTPDDEEPCEEPIVTFVYEGTTVVDLLVLATNEEEWTFVEPGSYLIRREDGQVTVVVPSP